MATETPVADGLARYVPRLNAEWDLHTSELWRELGGTLCYIDISGFTALSEKLARRGRIGAEELTEVLNYVFGKMLAIAYDRGGSLLKFGGDALLLLFRGTDHPIQACSAAVEMQTALREARSYETSAGRLHLKMSVGLHSGVVHLFRVGESHKELILTGPAASMTTTMEETAEAGEILISASTKDALPAGSATVQKGEGWVLRWRKARIECRGWSPRVALDPEAVAVGLPTALREYLQVGIAEPEHHMATVGFIKYQGVDALMEAGGPSAVAEALDELVRSVQKAVDDEGVTFLASDIDQDGGKIILVAGVPGVQEDDEGRVLRAARRIADRDSTLALRIGINQGHVFVGEIGTEFRATYTIMGDTVNLAARLMAAASPGEVFVSPAVLDRSHTLFETTALEPFHVKGKEQAVAAFAVGPETGDRPTDRGGELPFVGRVEEIRQLTDALTRLERGQGGTISVVGERGIGKTRLVDEALAALGSSEHVNIRSEPYGVGTPYRPLRDPVRAILGVQRATQAEMAHALEAGIKALDPTLLPMVPLIADIAMVEVASTPEADAIEPRFRQDRATEVLIALLQKVFPDPVVFDVEDGHWMDDASVHVLSRIAKATKDLPWLVLTTRRNESGGFEPQADELQLGPLSDEEARQLVMESTEAAPLRPHDIDAIIARTGGLPLFLQEIIGAAREAGGVDALPDSLDAVVATQIDALSPLPRRLLRYASVLGRSFRIASLNQLLAEEQVELDSAGESQLLGFLDRVGDDRLQFRHALLRDVAYGSLSFRKRAELHGRAGVVAEAEAGENVETVADMLALHFELAGVHEKAWLYGCIAGDRARAVYANVEAAEGYERALRAARGLKGLLPGDVADVWTRLGDAREDSGLFEASLEAYTKASRLVRDDPVRKAQTLYKRARARERSGAYSQALRELTTAENLLDGVDSASTAAVRAQLLATRAQVHQAQEKPEDALRVATEAAAVAEASGNREALASAYVRIDWANLFLGRPDEAVYGEKALAIYKELGDLGAQAIVISNEGFAAYFDGRWDEAVRLYEEGREAFRRAGNAVHAAHGASNIGEVLVNQERFDEAEPLLRDSIRVLQASDFLDGVAFGSIQLGRALTGLSRLEEAEAVLQEALDQARSMGITSMSATDAATFLAECMLAQGDAQGALKILNESAPADGGDFVWQGAVVARVRGAVLAALNREDEAMDALEAGLAEARERDLAYEQGLLLRLKSEIDPSDAEAAQEAKALLDRLGVGRQPVTV